MKLKSLTKQDLQDKILWAKVYVMVLEYGPRYESQTEEERKIEYTAKHELYRKYWDEAYRRGMVENSSEQLEAKK